MPAQLTRLRGPLTRGRDRHLQLGVQVVQQADGDGLGGRGHLERAELAAIIGKSDDAATSLKELKERFASGAYAQYASALQMVDAKQTSEAAALLRKLRQQKIDARLAAKIAAKLRELEGTP